MTRYRGSTSHLLTMDRQNDEKCDLLTFLFQLTYEGATGSHVNTIGSPGSTDQGPALRIEDWRICRDAQHLELSNNFFGQFFVTDEEQRFCLHCRVQCMRHGHYIGSRLAFNLRIPDHSLKILLQHAIDIFLAKSASRTGSKPEEPNLRSWRMSKKRQTGSDTASSGYDNQPFEGF